MRAAAVQLQCDDRHRGEPRVGGAPRARRGGRRRRAGGAARAARHPRRAGGLPRRRGAARRAARSSWARGLAHELGIDLVAGSIAERREGRERISNTSVHVGPDGEMRAVYRKIHMFDVEVGGTVYRESEHSEAGGRDRPLRDRERRRPRPDRLLRPPLPRALPHPRVARRADRHGAGDLHAHHRRGPLGGAPASPRDRGPGLRDRAGPGQPAGHRPGQLRQLDDRRPVGRGPRPRARWRAST